MEYRANMGKNEFTFYERIKAIEKNPEAFKTGYALGELAIRDPWEAETFSSIAHQFGESLREGYIFGLHVNSAAEDFLSSSEPLQEAASV